MSTRRSVINLWILLLVSACATPTSPSGGSPDSTGPVIIRTDPVTGTINFEGDEIRIWFSEFVNRSSLREAISVEPDLGLEYSLNWSRRSVTIEFENDLPELATVIVTIGTDLRDVRNNGMGQPVTVAVSTGPEIDEGEVIGRIIDARTGRGNAGDRVFLYRVPAELDESADYVAETDTAGVFHFNYLGPGEYKVFWVDDQNRSKIWERGNERAQPFSRETVTLEAGDRDTLSTLFKAGSDTLAPSLQGVGLFSSRRLRLRFSENINLTDSTRLAVTDTLGEFYAEVAPLYVTPGDQYILFAQSSRDLPEDRTFQLEIQNIRDEAGNVNPLMNLVFDGSSQADTTRQRIIMRRNPGGIFPGEPLQIVYAAPLTGSEFTDSVQVAAGTELIAGWNAVEVENNVLSVFPQGSWERGLDYEVRVWNPVTLSREPYPLDVWHSVDYGGIEFSLQDTTDSRSYRLSLVHSERGTMVDTTFTGSIEIDGLPPLAFRSTVYTDLDGDGRWDSGGVEPYIPPEPYFVQDRIPVSPGFTSEVVMDVNH